MPHKGTTCEALLTASEVSPRQEGDEGALAGPLAWHPSPGHTRDLHSLGRHPRGAGGRASYLDDDTRRLGEVPERQAEQAHERRLGLVGLGAAGAQDAAACKQSASPSGRLARRLRDLPEPPLTRTNPPAPHAGPALSTPFFPVSVTGS